MPTQPIIAEVQNGQVAEFRDTDRYLALPKYIQTKNKGGCYSSLIRYQVNETNRNEIVLYAEFFQVWASFRVTCVRQAASNSIVEAMERIKIPQARENSHRKSTCELHPGKRRKASKQAHKRMTRLGDAISDRM